MQKNKIMAIAALTCAFSGFGIGLLDVQQEAEAALLSDLPLGGSLDSFQSPNPPAEPVVQEVLIAEPQEPVKLYTEADVEMLARLIWVEARGVKSRTEQAAVVWCVLNRLDNPDRLEKSIAEVVCAPYQFDYRPWVPITDEFKALAADVLERWQAEGDGQEDVGRVLPVEYQYFEGWGGRNWFSAKWKSQEYWDWGLASPYED